MAAAEAEAAARTAVMLIEGALIFARVERSAAAITAAADVAARLFETAVAAAARQPG